MTHYAIRNQQGKFIAQQGKHTWLEDICTGWAICSTDRQWVQSIADTLADCEVVDMLQTASFKFILKNPKL